MLPVKHIRETMAIPLRLDGQEKNINDNARARSIVLHGAPYVDHLLSVLSVFLEEVGVARQFPCRCTQTLSTR